MFKPISASLAQRHEELRVKGQETRVIQEVLKDFGPALGIFYDRTKKQLTLETKSKALASQILMCSAEISAQLKTKGLVVEYFVVR